MPHGLIRPAKTFEWYAINCIMVLHISTHVTDMSFDLQFFINYSRKSVFCDEVYHPIKYDDTSI